MLRYAVTFFIIAIIAAFFGFGNVFKDNTADVGKLLFFTFITLFVIAIIFGAKLTKRKRF